VGTRPLADQAPRLSRGRELAGSLHHLNVPSLRTQRMKSPLIQPDSNGRHILTVMRYGDLNPVRAGLVRSPKDYAWSSYRHYAFGETNPLIDDEPEYLALGNTPEQRRLAYRHLFASPLIAALRIRRPDIVEAAFYGDVDWARQRLPRAAGPPG
jgi:putative transposase